MLPPCQMAPTPPPPPSPPLTRATATPPCLNRLPTPRGLVRSHSVVRGGREEVLRQTAGDGGRQGGGEDRKSSGGKQKGEVQQLVGGGVGLELGHRG